MPKRRAAAAVKASRPIKKKRYPAVAAIVGRALQQMRNLTAAENNYETENCCRGLTLTAVFCFTYIIYQQLFHYSYIDPFTVKNALIYVGSYFSEACSLIQLFTGFIRAEGTEYKLMEALFSGSLYQCTYQLFTQAFPPHASINVNGYIGNTTVAAA